MVDARTLLAAVLGLLLGAICLFAPDAVVRSQTAGRRPTGRSGEYGTDATPDRWRRLVQGLGVGLVLAGLYFGYTALG
ncbi:MAG: hypothetical protein ABEJ73_11025 [Haloplanus sp.]